MHPLAPSASPGALALTVLLLGAGGAGAQALADPLDARAFQVPERRCGLPTAAGPGFALLDDGTADCSASGTVIQPGYEPDGGLLFQIPVVFHVIEDTAGNGQVSDAAIRSQVDVLNEDYQSLFGSPGALGTKTRVLFYLATEDPMGNPTMGITRSVDDTWYADQGSYWTSLAWDTSRYLNVYTNSASGFLGYVPGLPQWGGLVGAAEDRVVALWSAVGRDAPIGPPYDQGRTLTHEIGHYLGLLHPFQEGCVPASTCYSNGDLICDTNPQGAPTLGCPAPTTSCGSSDSSDNYMDYTDDVCMLRFTAEQANRMRCTLENWRPELHQPLCDLGLASGSSRNAGANPSVYVADPPVLGSEQEYSVATAPWSFATIVGYLGSGSFVLGGGQVVLVDIASPRIFQLGPLPGPAARAVVIVPRDIGLCGITLSTQALLFGGVKPFALSNALDLTAGS